MFGYRPLSVMMEVVLLLFRDKIITDGMVIPYNIAFGRGTVADFKDVYMNTKKTERFAFRCDFCRTVTSIFSLQLS